MDRWFGGWMVGWIVRWLGGWMVGWLDGWLGGWMVGWLDGWLGGWVDYSMGGLMDDWIDAHHLWHLSLFGFRHASYLSYFSRHGKYLSGTRHG